jgi:threonine dehydrogenase-like Zn-dependent dehydrogenase
MKATDCQQVLFTAPEQAELVAVDVNTAPLTPQEVAGSTVTSLISAGTELAGYQGLWPWTDFPAAPGYSAVFRVEEVGAEVTDVRPGDLALCMGRHTSYQRVARHEMVLLPDGLTPEVAAFARMLNVTLTTLKTTAARPADKVMVMGLGLVGHLAAKNFIRCGYQVMAVDPDPGRRRLAQQSGIHAVYPTTPLDDPQIAKQVALVLECSGHEQAFVDACAVVRKRGEVVQVATPWRQQTQLAAHEIQRAVFFNYLVIRSGWEWELPRQPDDFRPHSIWGNLATAVQWLVEGSVQVDGLYEVASPQNAQEVYHRLLNRQVEKLAVIFDWRRLHPAG